MRAIGVLLLFIGMFLVIQGYYNEKMGTCPAPRTEIKYIPRSIYEEQLSGEERLNQQFKSMFDDINPWRR